MIFALVIITALPAFRRMPSETASRKDRFHALLFLRPNNFRSLFLNLVVLGVGLAATPAQAQPITYIFSGIGSGNVNSTNFTSATFSFSVTTDTSTIYHDGLNVF